MQKASKSNRSGYESLLKVYRETDLSQEKTRILGIDIFHQTLAEFLHFSRSPRPLTLLPVGSLGSSPDPDLVLKVLNFVLSSEVSNLSQLVCWNKNLYTHIIELLSLFHIGT